MEGISLPWQENVSRNDRKISLPLVIGLTMKFHRKKKWGGEIPFRTGRLVSFPYLLHLRFQPTATLSLPVWQRSGVTVPRVLLPQPHRELPPPSPQTFRASQSRTDPGSKIPFLDVDKRQTTFYLGLPWWLRW